MQQKHLTLTTSNTHSTEKRSGEPSAYFYTSTVFELILAIGYYSMTFSNPHLIKHLLNGVFIVLTLAKAFFIIAEFMHLRHEIRNLILTISIPALLFVWFITAFLWDGNSYKNLRNTYDRHHLEHSKEPAPEKKAW